MGVASNDVVSGLQSMMHDENDYVAEAAEEALDLISGE
jgi:hypothetical protein